VTLDIHVVCRRIAYNDLQAIAPEQYFKQITKRLAKIKAVSVSGVSFSDGKKMWRAFCNL
jgi:uncharacterized membrane protein YwzB